MLLLALQGLFRVAASGTRVKKLKAAFDANVVDLEEYKHDVHCIAGDHLLVCFKCVRVSILVFLQL